MLPVSDAFKQAMLAPVRTFRAQTELRLNTTNTEEITVFTDDDAIKSIEIQRVGNNSKFYGFGICQRLNMKLVDLTDNINPVSKSAIKVRIGIVLSDGIIEYVNWPTFYLSYRTREEEEGELSLTAYDKLDEATLHTVSELVLPEAYTIKDFCEQCAALLGLGFTTENVPAEDFSFNLNYENGANFEGTEKIRDALDAAAEATSCIYFIDDQDRLHFKRLDISGEPLALITPEDYFTLRHSDNRRLSKVMHVTELGDNVSAELSYTGTTAYIRNNPFWENREDIADVVEDALQNVGGLTINQFDCAWRGNLPLECGDKIDLQQVCIDGCVESAYVLDDVITYDGSFGQQTQWSYSGSDNDTESAPSSIGEAINQTYAKVDKINRTIELVASTVDDNTEAISQIRLTTNDITQSVTRVEENINNTTEVIEGEIQTLISKVESVMTPEELQIEITKAIEQGTNKVETITGFTFNEEGLTVAKTDSEMSTQITENGMTVYRDDTAVLVADNEGVYAANLHATTYLIIGENSRFEDYVENGESRTGCFWIGN